MGYVDLSDPEIKSLFRSVVFSTAGAGFLFFVIFAYIFDKPVKAIGHVKIFINGGICAFLCGICTAIVIAIINQQFA